MSFQVVGVIGLAGHGKDSVAEVFVEKYGYARISLADKLKEEVAALFSQFPQAQLDMTMHGKKVDWVRRLLQVWGTEGRRDIDERWWLKESPPLPRIPCRCTGSRSSRSWPWGRTRAGGAAGRNATTARPVVPTAR